MLYLVPNPYGRYYEEVEDAHCTSGFLGGVGQDQVKTMIKGITKVIADLGVPKQAIEVIVYEIPKTHWGVGGQPCSEVLKDIQPPK